MTDIKTVEINGQHYPVPQMGRVDRTKRIRPYRVTCKDGFWFFYENKSNGALIAVAASLKQLWEQASFGLQLVHLTPYRHVE